ncbi:hypothetical protein EIN_153840 [Entamoeba invadens IP1]|uniref:Uncharacterized protein n=1 Tax=Entamoeba invadens IP1 TaxID=370355 RepID=A0A0A1U921_ENTIV|nr:hypothetical protein EIN_153840 [Entamoeba invadens IP1]ELP91347.1 hypothetical protein EIN_153840 [Entamoeba invadens IP1]|eukprot:XP_004258118.1 hypothetical protein EIN_153840 [Entamoeba invadens IP1]
MHHKREKDQNSVKKKNLEKIQMPRIFPQITSNRLLIKKQFETINKHQDRQIIFDSNKEVLEMASLYDCLYSRRDVYILYLTEEGDIFGSYHSKFIARSIIEKQEKYIHSDPEMYLFSLQKENGTVRETLKDQILTHPKEREREFYDHLLQLSRTFTSECLDNFHHFCERYLKGVTHLLVPSYCIDFLLSNMAKNCSTILSIFQLFATQRDSRKRMLYLRLPSILMQTKSNKSMNLLSLLLSPTSSFNIYKPSSNAPVCDPLFTKELMTLCPTYIYPQSMSSDKLLEATYHSWRYISLTGNSSLIPPVDSIPTDTVVVNEQALIKQLYEITKERAIQPITNVIHVLYSFDGVVLMRDKLLVQTIRMVLTVYEKDEEVVAACVEALRLSSIDYHCVVTMLFEGFLDFFKKFLVDYKSNEGIIKDVVRVIVAMCGTNGLVSEVSKSGILEVLFSESRPGVERDMLIIGFQCIQGGVMTGDVIDETIAFDNTIADVILPVYALIVKGGKYNKIEELKTLVKGIVEGSKEKVGDQLEAALYFMYTTAINPDFIKTEEIKKCENSVDYNIKKYAIEILNNNQNTVSVGNVLQIPIEIEDSNVLLCLSVFSYISNVLITGVEPNKLSQTFLNILDTFPIAIFKNTEIEISKKYIAATYLITFIIGVLGKYAQPEDSELIEDCYSKLLAVVESNQIFVELWYEQHGNDLLDAVVPKYSSLKLMNEVFKTKEVRLSYVQPKNDKPPISQRLEEFMKSSGSNDEMKWVLNCLEKIMLDITHSQLNHIAIAVMQKTETIVGEEKDPQFVISVLKFLKKAVDESSLVCTPNFVRRIIERLNVEEDDVVKRFIYDLCGSIANTCPKSLGDISLKTKLRLTMSKSTVLSDQELYMSMTRCLAALSKIEKTSYNPRLMKNTREELMREKDDQQVYGFDNVDKPTILIVPVGEMSDYFFLEVVSTIWFNERAYREMENSETFSFLYEKTTWELFKKEASNILFPQIIFGVLDCSGLNDKKIIQYVMDFKESSEKRYEESCGNLVLLFNLSMASDIYMGKIPPLVKDIVFTVDSLAIGSTNSIHAFAREHVGTFCDKSSHLIQRYNPIFKNKVPPISYLRCAMANLYRKNYDNAYNMFSDGIKAYKNAQNFNGKLYNRSVIGLCVSILLDPSKRNLASYTKEWEETIKDSVKFIDGQNIGHYYCKELLFFQTQFYIKAKNKERMTQLIEEIDSKHHEKISCPEDVFSALVFDHLLKQMHMNHHRQHVLYAISAYKTTTKSFEMYCIEELSELLGVKDLELLDQEFIDQNTRPHAVMQRKVQWSTLRAYVMMKKVMMRDVYDENMAVILLRLLVYFHEHVSDRDQIESLNRLHLISQSLGKPVFIGPNMPSLPIVESVTITPIQENEQIVGRVKGKSVFIFDPSLPRNVFTAWSANETAYVTIKMRNPLYPMLQVDNIMPWCEGVDIETHFKCVDIAQSNTTVFNYAIRPKHAGVLKIYGLDFDCCSMHFRTVPANFRGKKDLTPCCVIPVVNSVPRLQPAPGTFLSKAIALFPGQTNESKLEFVNDGELAVDWVEFRIKDDDSTKLTEVTIPKPLQSILPILPNQRVEIPLAISARGEVSKIDIEINFATTRTARFGRKFSVPIRVIVSVGLLIDKWEIIPIEEVLLVSCVVYNPSAFSFTVKIIPTTNWIVDDFFVQERRETFSESQSRRRLIVCVKKPSFMLTTKNAAKWINEAIAIKWTSSSGCDGTISMAESEKVELNTSN